MKKLLITSVLISSLIIWSTGCNTVEKQTLAQPQPSQIELQKQQTQSVSNPTPSNIEYYFTRANQHPDLALEKQIDSAKSTLDIAIYSLTKKEIVNSIINAKNRDVNVRIITDKIEAKSKSEIPEITLLKGVNIPVKENSHSGLMHMKVSIIDGGTVTTGSYNYTQGASTVNDEVLVIIHDSNIAGQWENEFNQMWNDNKNFIDVISN